MFENEKSFINFFKNATASLPDVIKATGKINFFTIPVAVLGEQKILTSIIFLPLVFIFFIWLTVIKKKHMDVKYFLSYKITYDIYFAVVIQLFNYKMISVIDKYTDLNMPVPFWLVLSVIFIGAVTYLIRFLLVRYRITTGYYIDKKSKKRSPKAGAVGATIGAAIGIILAKILSAVGHLEIVMWLISATTLYLSYAFINSSVLCAFMYKCYKVVPREVFEENERQQEI